MSTSSEFSRKIQEIQGPILVLGASGFIGANLFQSILKVRDDVRGTSLSRSAWRLKGLPEKNVISTDLLVEYNLRTLMETTKPRTLFNCVAYGAYSFEKEFGLIYRTNLSLTANLLEALKQHGVTRYVHAGSSSEYGDITSAPLEDSPRIPNSHYAISKAASSDLIHYFGKKLQAPCVNLRLYSVYGQLEDSARLIPNVIAKGLQGQYPPFVDPAVSRDFVYIDDVCEAFIDAALGMKPEHFGESFNIGTGIKTSIADLASLAGKIYEIREAPPFASMARRDWDRTLWYANPEKAKKELGWVARTPLKEGLEKTTEWYRTLENPDEYHRSSKRFGIDETYSVSAVVACYKDAEAIPIMYARLKAVFEKLNVRHEIIFVNDNSPDNSEEIIRDLSSRDRTVLGISHSRNFGSQAAFRSGMEASTMNSVVLLDGDLQDPPELIDQFMEKWREGYEVIYGRRVKREATVFMQIAYKIFYKVFDRFSYISIPKDAGDFSLMEKKVVHSLLLFPERDFFVRGIRAFAGFKQTGVDYLRPKRMFGVTTNNFWKNIGWAKKGILSFSNAPLNALSSLGVILFGFSMLLGIGQITVKFFYPAVTPSGLTTTILMIIFFGSINLMAVSIIGEYVAKILEEVKRRPHFIRRHIIKDGDVREAVEDLPGIGRQS